MESSEILKPLSGVELTHLTYALVVVATFFGLSSLYLVVRLHRLTLLYKKMMQGATGESIETMMLDRIQDIEALKKNVAELRQECEKLDAESRTHIQQVGIVRFNAFDNTGSDLSFAVAMLDAANSGMVLSGIYGREESRVYAKPVLKGESTYMLTKEERQALETAYKK
ncbi:MAG TPA: DUF4446 family protein [Negativicutes bacterium]|nr:DUF4446 family protein [Negativicutes bacterium]